MNFSVSSSGGSATPPAASDIIVPSGESRVIPLLGEWRNPTLADITIPAAPSPTEASLTTLGLEKVVDSFLEMQAEQNADFTAELNKEYPVDTSALTAGQFITVTAPTATAAGDSFAVFCSRLTCDNGVVGIPRSIRVVFAADNIHSLPAPDYAVINSAGARLEFTYVDTSIGWRIASNVNN